VIKRLLRLRRLMNSKRPRFIRMNVQGLRRIKDSWRKPRGLDNKIRICRRGYPEMVSVGYRNPKPVRGLHPSGLEEVLVYNPSQLDGLNPKRHCVRIARTVSRRKKLEIAEKAAKLKLRVVNPPTA